MSDTAELMKGGTVELAWCSFVSDRSVAGRSLARTHARTYTRYGTRSRARHSLARTGHIEAREKKLRESWVKAMEAHLVRTELVKCQRYEGVNHLENCAWLSQKYLGMLQENKVRSICGSVSLDGFDR